MLRWLLLPVCCGALALAFGVLSAQAQQQQRADYCALPGAAASLVLVDRTSPYSTTGEDREGERIAAGIDALLRTLNAGDRLTIATIERQRRLSLPAFDDCFPGCDPRRVSPIPFLSDCPTATVEQRRKEFRRALYAAVIPLLQNDIDEPYSDITGTIYQSSAQHRFERVYLYSDMLENSQVLPWLQFSAQPPERSFAEVQRSGFIPVLRGAQVQVVGFGLSHTRNHPALTDPQDRTIREFWRLYFGAGGANVTYRTAISP